MIESLKTRYEKGYIRLDQLRQYVALEVITAEQYKEICGVEYENNLS